MKTIREQLEDICEEVCDKICKYPDMPVPEGKTDNWLFEEGSPCEDCPLNKLQ